MRRLLPSLPLTPKTAAPGRRPGGVGEWLRRSALPGLLLTGLGSAAEPPRTFAPIPSAAMVNQLFAGWRAPVLPRRLIGNIHYVGASGVSSFLITTPEGHFLLDTGFEDTVPIIRQGVEQLGFRLSDIRLILSSHAHIDHVGGHARMKELTGASVLASAADARTLESGGADDFIRWPPETIRYAPVKVDRIIADGERVTLGGVTLTAHLTPGHTRGATTWTIEVADGASRRPVVFFSSATINAGTRLIDNPRYPGFVREFEATFEKLRALPCEVFFAPHGGQFAMGDKLERLDQNKGENPFVDPAGWKKLLATAEQAFRDQLRLERAAPAPGKSPLE